MFWLLLRCHQVVEGSERRLDICIERLNQESSWFLLLKVSLIRSVKGFSNVTFAFVFDPGGDQITSLSPPPFLVLMEHLTWAPHEASLCLFCCREEQERIISRGVLLMKAFVSVVLLFSFLETISSLLFFTGAGGSQGCVMLPASQRRTGLF